MLPVRMESVRVSALGAWSGYISGGHSMGSVLAAGAMGDMTRWRRNDASLLNGPGRWRRLGRATSIQKTPHPQGVWSTYG